MFSVSSLNLEGLSPTMLPVATELV